MFKTLKNEGMAHFYVPHFQGVEKSYYTNYTNQSSAFRNLLRKFRYKSLRAFSLNVRGKNLQLAENFPTPCECNFADAKKKIKLSKLVLMF